MQDYITREDGRYMTDQIKARPITRELTLAEYKELSPEDKKKNVLYIITDATPEGGDITIDTALDSTSDNAVMNKAITLAIDAAVEDIGKNRSSIAALDVSVKALEEKVDSIDGLTVDTDLDATSENPVQNKAITLKVTDLQDAIGDLSALKTSDKTSLVDAVNEIYEDGGGSGGGCIDYTLDGALNDGTLELSLSNGSSIQKLEVGGFVEAEDTGWITAENEYLNFVYRKMNGVVYVMCNTQTKQAIPATSGANGVELGTLPEGYRPSRTIYMVGSKNVATQFVLFMVASNGVVQLRTAEDITANSYIGFFQSFPADN